MKKIEVFVVNLWRLRKKSYPNMNINKVIRFFNYNTAYDFYTNGIKRMKQGNIKKTGIKKIAKPVLLLSIIKGIENGKFKYNKFLFADVEEIYNNIFELYSAVAKQQNENTCLSYPFYYLQSDEFWHLNFYEHSETKTNSPSEAWIKRNVEYGYIDEELWIMLHNADYRLRLKDFILNEKIKNNGNHISLLMKQFVCWLMAI